jgi:BlaI family transcriptional regulator, penicillinase repressor
MSYTTARIAVSQGHQKVAEAELAVLEFLWDHGETTTRDITDALYPRGAASDVATVQKLLHRLEAKGYVRRDRSPFAHRVQAAVSRTDFAGQQLQAVAERLSGGSLVPLLVNLVEQHALSAAEREKIRRLLEEQAPEQPKTEGTKP